MKKEERKRRTEARRQELIALLSERDNSRSLRRIIGDKLLILLGILGSGCILLWFTCASIFPLSYFGLIGRSDRFVVSEETGELVLEHCSAFKSAWSLLTHGARSRTVAIYDLFLTREPDVLKFIGGFGCTVLMLSLIFGFITIVSIYAKDIILVIKALVVIAKENNKDSIDDMKHAITDIRNFTRTDVEKDTYVEVKVPGQKKPGRPKGTKNKVSDEIKNEAITVEVKDNTQQVQNVAEETKVETETKVEVNEHVNINDNTNVEVDNVDNAATKEKTYTFDDLTTDELNKVVTGEFSSIAEAIAARENNND